MTIASDSQVQAFVTTRLRPRCEQIRALYNAMVDDIAAITDEYNNLTQGSPTWTDTNSGNPPALLSVGDVLALNEFWHTVTAAITAETNYSVVLRACRTPLN